MKSTHVVIEVSGYMALWFMERSWPATPWNASKDSHKDVRQHFEDCSQAPSLTLHSSSNKNNAILILLYYKCNCGWSIGFEDMGFFSSPTVIAPLADVERAVTFKEWME